MPEQTTPEPQPVAQTQSNLRQLAASLRETGHLEPETQEALANLLDELGTELDSVGLASANTLHLAQAVTEVACSLHEQRSVGLLAFTQDRLKNAAMKAEVEAPVATGVVYRLIDLLGSIGI